MRFAFRIVSSRDVAVRMCEEPAVREVKRKRSGLVSYEKVGSVVGSRMARGGVVMVRSVWECGEVCGSYTSVCVGVGCNPILYWCAM